jgi:Integrase core domain
MGIRDRPISPRSPWQNPYAERLIGTLRRECLDHVLIVGERHLRRMLASYSSYYNESRTHLAVEKDAPLRRAIQRCGAIITTAIAPSLCADMIFGKDRASEEGLSPAGAGLSFWPCGQDSFALSPFRPRLGGWTPPLSGECRLKRLVAGRDYCLTGEMAMEWGIVDKVINKRPEDPAALKVV